MIRTLLVAAAISSAITAGCSSSSSTGGVSHDLDKMRQVLDTNANIAYAVYSDAVITAQTLKSRITDLRNDQDQAALDAAKLAWLVAREPYGQSEVYRFRASPIDDTDYDPSNGEDGPEGSINAWPLGEALIDYVIAGNDFGDDQVGVTEHAIANVNSGMAITASYADANPNDNIINQTSITINQALLESNATAADEHDVISGYHAIEFLLWGQDLNAGNDADTYPNLREAASAYPLDSGGHRPITDFQTGGSCTNAGAAASDTICARRLDYLDAAVDKLIADLTSVRNGWAPGAAYRSAFTTINSIAEGKTRLLEILTGMGTLSEGELAGERIQIALSANSQEDEHSCFSDNTHRDIWLDAEGVSNSYYGSYAGYDSTLDGTDNVTTNAVNGYGIDDYLRDLGQTELAADVETAFAETEDAYTDIDAKARAGMPFDNLIVAPNGIDAEPVRRTIQKLNAQSAQIARIATELDLGSADDVVDPEASACDTSNPTSSC